MSAFNRPLAFVDESGYVVPTPTFNSESMKHIKGRFIYTQSEFDQAIRDMNRRQEERRVLADRHYGSDAILAPVDYEVIDEVVDELAGQRETVPSFSASPNRPRKTTGKSKKLTQPNYAELPDTLNVPQQGVGLTEEEREDLQGIDVASATRAMFR